jgi:hypothetical protein
LKAGFVVNKQWNVPARSGGSWNAPGVALSVFGAAQNAHSSLLHVAKKI